MKRSKKPRPSRIRLAYDLGYESGFNAGFEENEYNYLDGCMDSLIAILNNFFDDQESEEYIAIAKEIEEISKRKRKLKSRMNLDVKKIMKDGKNKDSNKFYELLAG